MFSLLRRRLGNTRSSSTVREPARPLMDSPGSTPAMSGAATRDLMGSTPYDRTRTHLGLTEQMPNLMAGSTEPGAHTLRFPALEPQTEQTDSGIISSPQITATFTDKVAW